MSSPCCTSRHDERGPVRHHTRLSLALVLAALCGSLALPCWTVASAQGSGSDDTSGTGPRRPVLELTLRRALAMAAQNSRRLKLAALQTDEAEARRRILRAEYFPHIRNESAALYVTALEGVTIPAGAFAHGPATGLIPGATLTLDQGAKETFTSGTGLAQPLTQLLTVHAGVKAATADVNIAAQQARDAGNAVALEVHQLYYTILIAQSRLRGAQAALQADTVVAQESARAVSEGRSLDVARLQSEATLLAAKQEELSGRLALDDLFMQFDDVLGVALGTPLQLDESSLGDGPSLPAVDAAVERLKANSPRVLAAREQVDKARAGVTAARDAYIPNITALSRYSYQSGLPFLVHNFGTFGGSFTYELFDGGAREAKLKQAHIAQHMAEVQLAQTEADLAIEVYALYDKLSRLQQMVDVAAESLKVRQESARVSRERLASDAALPSEAANADAGTRAAETSVLQARFDLRLTQEQVQQLLGDTPQ